LKKIYSLKDIQYHKLEAYIKIIPVSYKTTEYSKYPEYKKRSEETAREINITNRKADFICNCHWTRQRPIPAP
jgi:hypothetical protein